MDFPPEMPDEARLAFEQGYEAQMSGRIDEAVDHYRRSIAIHPTAEAHTFLGWALSFLGRPDEAIAECETAIAVDPAFGNPYNDIGAYLIDLAARPRPLPGSSAPSARARYEPRHYPYFNLARVYVKQHKVREAIGELQQAIAIEPRYTIARRELHRLLGMLN